MTSPSDPAFPTNKYIAEGVMIKDRPETYVGPHWQYIPGLTKRELFSVIIANGCLSCFANPEIDYLRLNDSKIAQHAVRLAYVLLAELEKK